MAGPSRMPHTTRTAIDKYFHTEEVIADGPYVSPVVVPSPHCPFTLEPQQFGSTGRGGAGGRVMGLAEGGAGPGMPQTASFPAATADQVLLNLTTVSTVTAIIVPMPSWPFVFCPEQYRWPRESMAHVTCGATETDTHVPAVLTGVGTFLLKTVPMPSCPYVLIPCMGSWAKL